MAFWNLGPTESKLKTKKVREEGCTVVLDVEVPREKVRGPLEDAFAKIQGRAKVAGFRPGKAPMDVVKQQFAREAESLMVDEVVRGVLPDVVQEQGLTPVSVPILHEVEFQADKPLKFQISFEVPPKVDAKDYKKIPLTKKSAPVDDKRVDTELESLRQRNARLGAVLTENVEKDHIVMVDYQGFLAGSPIEGAKGESEWVDMAAPQTVAGLTEGILGARRGETREFPVSLQGGEKAVFRVTVREIKKKMLPNLDDEFAKDLGMSTMLEVRAKLREALEHSETRRADQDLERQIEEHLLKANPIPVPDSQVDQELKRLAERFKQATGIETLEGPQGETLAKNMKEQAESSVRIGYLLRNIAEKEKLSVSEPEIEAEKKKSLEAAESDEDKKKTEEFFSKYKRQVENVILERKVWQFLKESAKIKEA